MKTYLGGPIFNVSRKDAVAWRAKAKEELQVMGIEVNDPNERPYIPGKEIELVDTDLKEIAESNVLIAHTPEDTQMNGTSMEIFYAAYVLKIPVLTFPHNPSPWLVRWSTHSFVTLDALLEYVKKNYGSQRILQAVAE